LQTKKRGNNHSFKQQKYILERLGNQPKQRQYNLTNHDNRQRKTAPVQQENRNVPRQKLKIGMMK
jgi:hypothetical protein